jgi:hypothetical protein
MTRPPLDPRDRHPFAPAEGDGTFCANCGRTLASDMHEPPAERPTKACPHCDHGTMHGPNGRRWRCSFCRGGGRVYA